MTFNTLLPSLVFFLFADDTNILYTDKHFRSLESAINSELANVYEWLTANRLTLNTKKSNFVIFRPRQKVITYQPKCYCMAMIDKANPALYANTMLITSEFYLTKNCP